MLYLMKTVVEIGVRVQLLLILLLWNGKTLINMKNFLHLVIGQMMQIMTLQQWFQ